jgi:hypothetical protein
MARVRGKKNPNADLIEAVQNYTEEILLFYESVEDDRPVILFDFQKQRICAYHYEEYKTGLNVESQAVFDEEYEKAEAEDKLLVLVWDSATGRLVVTTFEID